MCASVSQYFALCVCVHVLHNDKKQKNAVEFLILLVLLLKLLLNSFYI